MFRMIANLSVLTRTRENRIPTLLMAFAVVSCLSTATATAQAPQSTGDIFFDHFDGPAGPLPVAADNTLFTNEWGHIPLGENTLDGTTLLKVLDNAQRHNLIRSNPLDFSGSPDEWVAETRFQVNGKLYTEKGGGGPTPRQFNLLSGMNSRAPFGTDTWEHIGVDLRLERLLSDTDGTASTFDMTWHGWDSASGFRSAESIAGGSGLNKGQFYVVTAHRKDNDMVDIYLDGSLIDTKDLLVGIPSGTNSGQENPNHIEFGDISGGGVVIDEVIYDYFTIGSPVPEPACGALMLLGICGLAAGRGRRA